MEHCLKETGEYTGEPDSLRSERGTWVGQYRERIESSNMLDLQNQWRDKKNTDVTQ
jgi:hypothetical protein